MSEPTNGAPAYVFAGTHDELAAGLCSVNTYRDVDGPSSALPQLDWDTYQCFRPGEGTPQRHRDIMKKTKEIYDECGIIRNIVDLQTDLTYRGIRISHPRKSRDRLYKQWWEGLGGTSFAERFCHYGFRSGNIALMRHIGKLKVKRIDGTVHTYKIPMKYSYINPAIISTDDNDLGAFTGQHHYVINYRQDMASSLRSSLNFRLGKENKVELWKDKNFLIFFFRKDDWDAFAKPFTYPLIKEVSMLNKLDLAERTALDSAINHIRIYKLGDLEAKLVPMEGAFARLDQILQANVGSGCTNILWGPDIQLIESNSDFYKFLGEEKYKPTFNKIYQGSGIPVLGSGSANSDHLALTVLIERLEYGRMLLNKFLYGELAYIQQVLGDRDGAEFEYDIPTFTDAAAHRSLLIQLADRGLISDELLQTLFKHNSNMEDARIIREEKERDSGRRVRKVGPFIDSDFEHALLKMAVMMGLLTPEDLGDRYKRLKDFDYQDLTEPGSMEEEPTEKKNKGQPQQGRPRNSKDSSKRTRRTFRPINASVQTELWALKAHDNIVEHVKPLILANSGKKSMRELTSQQFKDYEDLVAGILFNLIDGHDSPDDIVGAIDQPINSSKVLAYRGLVAELSTQLNRELTSNERKFVQAFVYANL